MMNDIKSTLAQAYNEQPHSLLGLMSVVNFVNEKSLSLTTQSVAPGAPSAQQLDMQQDKDNSRSH